MISIKDVTAYKNAQKFSSVGMDVIANLFLRKAYGFH